MSVMKDFSIKIPWSMRMISLAIFYLVVTQTSCDESSSQLPTAPTVLESTFQDKLRPQCPGLEPTIFEQSIPEGRHNVSVMSYTKAEDSIATLQDCTQFCCEDPKCNIAFMYQKDSVLTCYKVSCQADAQCLPISSPNSRAKSATKMVLIRPSQNESWASLLASRKSVTESTSNPLSSRTARPCEVGLDPEACFENEVCVALNSRSRSGACRCQEGFLKDNTGKCVGPDATPKDAVNQTSTTSSTSTSTPKPAPVQLTVQMNSKVVTLPENSSVLTAYALPEAPSDTAYKYEWKLEKGNAGGNMENSHASQLTLSQLKEGVYLFRVVVTGDNPPAWGEAYGNVSVLPAERINMPPTVILQPESQQISLPTSKAIIDASASRDDATPKDQLVFKWELKSEPLGYSKELKETGPTLTLDDLIPGSYTVQVSVVDADGAESQTAEATITVVPETDYPPAANAGEDIIVYLPQREVTLHGNQSSDDHGIVSWEWTRKTAQGTAELAADTQNMRTASPIISNLEEGMYTFLVKVTDVKGQFSQDEVKVYVKAPTSIPPSANAGINQEISLPQTWVILDGSASKDDVRIASYNWTQVSGPNEANLNVSNLAKVNATDLTKGKYVFQLGVLDNLNNTASALVEVTVNQDANMAPVAKAGDNFAVTLPLASVCLNGSASTDDLQVRKWLWTREPNSLAMGKIIGNSDSQPALQLGGLVPGQYTFKLQVWDEQGKSSTDSVTVTVKENPEMRNVVQGVFNADVSSLTQSEMDNLQQGLSLLLHSSGEYKVKILDLFPQQDSNYAVIQFLVVRSAVAESQAEAVGSSSTTDLALNEAAVASGKKVVKELKSKLRADSKLLSFTFLSLDTLICQNDCSGHGKCHQATRTCICEPFWVENFVRKRLFNGESNCDWSIVYVGIFIGLMGVVMICGICYLSYKKRKSSTPHKLGLGSSRGARNRQRYSRLQQTEPGIELRNAHTSSIMLSESDSEDEISFDSSPKIVNGGPRNGNATKRNAQGRKSPRISRAPHGTVHGFLVILEGLENTILQHCLGFELFTGLFVVLHQITSSNFLTRSDSWTLIRFDVADVVQIELIPHQGHHLIGTARHPRHMGDVLPILGVQTAQVLQLLDAGDIGVWHLLIAGQKPRLHLTGLVVHGTVATDEQVGI
eukprot:maker-scaffold124_size330879-snap-gene-1.31 protein:Tk01489 transcript:maker-scaffold124_size330879-snap-gene-1.31-mRNA-1 annotation:"hypothetical protein L798_13730"